MEALAQRYGFESGQAVLDVYEPIWEELAATKTKPMPGAAQLLRKLRALEIPMVLVTSGNRSYAHGVLDAFGMREMFACTVTEDDVSELKPSTEPYLLAAKSLGVTSAECVGFEDSPSGIVSLTAAGMYSIAIGSAVDAARDQPPPDLHVVSLAEITDAVLARLFISRSV
jgi:sugar-phosphatase